MKVQKLLILLPLVLLLTACPEDDPVKPDPCEGKKPVTAEFEIIEGSPINKIQLINQDDTVMSINRVTFKAIGNYDSYRWRLIDDPRIFSGQQHVVQFDEPYGKITVELIVQGKPNLQCFPDDDGIDTLYKDIFVKDRFQTSIYGNYKGVNLSNILDTFNVNIFPIKDLENQFRGIAVLNINKGCLDTAFYKYPEIMWNNSILNFKSNGGFNSINTCLAPSGYCFLDKNNFNKIQIEYSYKPEKSFVNDTFIGWRVE